MGDLIKRLKRRRSIVPKVYKPNHVLYGLILAAAVGITLLAALIPQSNPLFSILIGVGSGGIASVVVAWLIDRATCKQKNEKTDNIRRLVFAPLRSTIESSIEILTLQCLQLGAIKDFECKKTWINWLQAACDAAKNDPEELQLFCNQCCVLADNILEKVSVIISQTVSLFDSEAIDEEEQKCLSTIMTTCELVHIERKELGVTPKLAERYLEKFKLIRLLFGKLPVVSELNTELIGSTLIKKCDQDTLGETSSADKEES